MSVARLLRHRVTVLRPTDTGTEDGTGNPVETLATVATDVPAYVQERTGVETPDPSGEGMTVITAVVYLLPGADVRASDEVRRQDNGRQYRVQYVRDPAGQGRLLAADCTLGAATVPAP